jgi:hypothetical protein
VSVRDKLRDKVAAAYERGLDPASGDEVMPVSAAFGSQPRPALAPVTGLRFQPDQQPRDMLPPEAWQELLAAGVNDPAGTLVALRELAPHRTASQRVLEHVEGLARSIRAEGILLPLTLVPVDGHHVVLDGHCRAMAAVIADVADVPYRLESVAATGADAELTAASHRFLLNWTQQQLSPLEAMRELSRIQDLATDIVLSRGGEDAGAVLAALSADGEPDPSNDVTTRIPPQLPDQPDDQASDQPKLRRGQTRAQELAAAIRSLVLARTGLSLNHYHRIYRLRRLHPEAQAMAEGLSENHLMPIVTAPTELQPLLVQLVQATGASVKETRAYCRTAREQGEEYLRSRLLQALRRDEQRRKRTSVSWESLLHALPEDLSPRLSSLRAELAALPEDRREVRLRTLARQRALIEEVRHAYDDILALYGVAWSPADE